jgi:hypothetical protein
MLYLDHEKKACYVLDDQRRRVYTRDDYWDWDRPDWSGALKAAMAAQQSQRASQLALMQAHGGALGGMYGAPLLGSILGFSSRCPCCGR